MIRLDDGVLSAGTAMRRKKKRAGARLWAQALLFGAVFGIGAVRAQTPEAPAPTATPSLADGAARIGAGDPAGAVKILEAVAQREPKNPQAWRYLGFAYIKTKDYDRALASYRKLLEIATDMPQGLYNTGIVYALKGDTDRAFEWLQQACEERATALVNLKVEPAFDGLRGDRRFADLLRCVGLS